MESLQRYDVKCPYCNHGQEINHDDGYGYDEGVLHHQDCVSCDKIFVFTTQISFNYEVKAALCLNEEADHKWKSTQTFPKQFTEMICQDCGERRKPTEREWLEIN
ncbi:hypothetical protein EHQ12_04170 [Leptospira gomenensis]|uniref:Uncharacterized protein n=1 Tax=Leptospira gomenensis TaxID=2484974 RepID=A0A5F1YEX7_9LEPT|nr:hypothetical protein [Leptospira gomenensis]TGK36188.1 hypothetical protein EHQ17_04545 [Leptospira gomenensis]TGK42772.1 hypothetical protein EHQ07_13945 [Leptospira gomenensis]TGK42961.1 hypothetical protein EHQ12_04170 [Leptospira gomenensis]TGK54972.1 hypothetical protein EHQ13_18425 [Leptospira gomenensis]